MKTLNEFKGSLVEKANEARPKITREGMRAVRAMVRDHSLVFGVWPDSREPDGVGTLIVKGEQTLKLVAGLDGSAPTFSIDMTCAAVPCTCAEQAHALRLVHGDGADKPL